MERLVKDTAETANAAFGLRLREALARRGVRKLYPLALEIGVDESALSRWRQGRAISLDNAVRLALYLDISLDWLLTGRGTVDGHRGAPAVESDPAPDVDELRERLAGLPPAAVPLLLGLIDLLTVGPST